MTRIEVIERAVAILAPTPEEGLSVDALWRRVVYNDGLTGAPDERLAQRAAAEGELVARALEAGWPPKVARLMRAFRRGAITSENLAALLGARPRLRDAFGAAMAIDNTEGIATTIAALGRLRAVRVAARRNDPIDDAEVDLEIRLMTGDVRPEDIPPDGADDDYFLTIQDVLNDEFDITEYLARPWVRESRRRRQRALRRTTRR